MYVMMHCLLKDGKNSQPRILLLAKRLTTLFIYLTPPTIIVRHRIAWLIMHVFQIKILPGNSH